MVAGCGKCVEVFHVIGDTLCQLGKSPLRPDLGLPYAEDSEDTTENIQSDSQQINVDQAEVLSDKLDRLHFDENASEVIPNETDTLELEVLMISHMYD